MKNIKNIVIAFLLSIIPASIIVTVIRWIVPQMPDLSREIGIFELSLFSGVVSLIIWFVIWSLLEIRESKKQLKMNQPTIILDKEFNP